MALCPQVHRVVILFFKFFYDHLHLTNEHVEEVAVNSRGRCVFRYVNSRGRYVFRCVNSRGRCVFRYVNSRWRCVFRCVNSRVRCVFRCARIRWSTCGRKEYSYWRTRCTEWRHSATRRCCRAARILATPGTRMYNTGVSTTCAIRRASVVSVSVNA